LTIRSRLDRLEKSMGRRRGKFVVVRFDSCERDPAIAWNGPRNLALNLPGIEADVDPMDRLTPEQRAMIGPDDDVITITYVSDWRGMLQ
jgi:hypothetical protein